MASTRHIHCTCSQMFLEFRLSFLFDFVLTKSFFFVSPYLLFFLTAVIAETSDPSQDN